MKKQLLAFALGLSVLGVGSLGLTDAQAAHETVSEWNASWSYGTSIVWNGRRVYSNLSSSLRWHSSSVAIGEVSDYSGAQQPGITARASRVGPYTARGYSYYNIW